VSVFSVDATAADNTNKINFLLESLNDGGGGVINHVATDTAAANLNGLSANSSKKCPVLNPFVEFSPTRTMKWTVTKNADHAQTQNRVIGVRVRYRRKA
jgi:hypothetical protein